MALVLSVPHATSPHEDVSAIELKDAMVSILELTEIPHNVALGDMSKHMVDLATSAASNTLYSSELSAYLDIADYHIDIQSFKEDNNKEWMLDSIVIGHLETFQQLETLEGLQNTLDDVCNVTIRETPFEHSYASGMAKMIFGVDTLVIYVNELTQSMDAIAEKIIDYVI